MAARAGATAKGAPTEAEAKTWHERAMRIRKMKPQDSSNGNGHGNEQAQEGHTLLEAAAEVFGVEKTYTVDGRTFTLREPTWKQIKQHLFPAAVKLKDSAKEGQELLALLKGTEEFQFLMLDCMDFADGDRPDSVMDWADGLTATLALELGTAFVDAINWGALIAQAKALMGKIKGAS